MPWVIGVALLAFVMARTDTTAVWTSLRSVNPFAYLAFVVAFSVTNLAVDALASFQVYRLVTPALSLWELIVVRGASYLPTLINYHLGQAYLTYLLAQRYETPLRRVVGGTLLSYATLLATLIGLAALSLPLGAHAPWLRQFTLFLLVGVVAYLVGLTLKLRFVARRVLFELLFETGLRGHLKLMLWRLPHVIVLWGSLWIAYLFFGVDVPFSASIANIPIILMVSAVPLTPQGAGTRELVALELLTRYVHAPANGSAAIVAAGSAWVLATAFSQALIGLAFTGRATAVLKARSAPQRQSVPD